MDIVVHAKRAAIEIKRFIVEIVYVKKKLLLNQNLTYVLHVRTSESQLSCRSLNQNLPSVLDVDSLPGGQRGEAAAGEVKEVTIYECTIF